MLSREQAALRLNEFQVSEWQQRRLRSIARFPGHLKRVFTHELTEYSSLVVPSTSTDLVEAYKKGFEWLESTSPSRRKNIFRSLFPKIADYIEAGWQLYRNLPYQTGWQRKAFHCPNNPAVILPAKMIWISSLLCVTKSYEEDLLWFAEWAAYLPWGADHALGVPFAAAIDQGDECGERVFQILVDSANGEHEIGAMGKHVVRALLLSSREDGWTFIENLLLAAQRQEGLRQTILEAVDESHPRAFRRMLQLILEKDLTRFSSVFRAVDVWLGIGLDVKHKAQLKEYLQQILNFLTSAEQPIPNAEEEDAMTSYLRLWSAAYKDAEKVIDLAAGFLKDDRVDHRFIGVHLLAQLNLIRSHEKLLVSLDDPDLAVATRALLAFSDRKVGQNFENSDLFERIERNIDKFPKKKRVLSINVFPWMAIPTERSSAAGALITCLGSRTSTRLIPYIKTMKPYDRAKVAELLAGSGRWDSEKHSLFIELLGDPSAQVREKAIRKISKRKINLDDVQQIESLLTRKAGDLRRGLLVILMNQRDSDALSSAERLLDTGNRMQRLAGLEIVRKMLEDERNTSTTLKLANKLAAMESELSADEKVLIDRILIKDKQPVTLEDGLGLFNPADRTAPTPPRPLKSIETIRKRKRLVSDGSSRCLASLDDLIHKHREDSVAIDLPTRKQEDLLGNIRWLHFLQRGRLPSPLPEFFPLQVLLDEWWADEGSGYVKADPYALLQAFSLLGSGSRLLRFTRQDPGWQKSVRVKLFGDLLEDLKYPGILQGCLEWLIFTHPAEDAVEYLLDAIEASFSLIPKRELAKVPDPDRYYAPGWRSDVSYLSWLILSRTHLELFKAEWDDRHLSRLWGLLRWMDEPGTAVPRHRPLFNDLLHVFRSGGATEADVIDHLIGPRRNLKYGGYNFHDFSLISRRNPPQDAAQFPKMMEIVDRCRKRVVEVELGRGDLPTAATGPALALRWSGGGDVFIATLRAFGKAKLVRGWTYDRMSKASTLSHFLRVSYPRPEDTEEEMSEALSKCGFSHSRLIEAAVYAPQWASHIERVLGWDGFAEGVWWIHAHTKDTRWSVEQEIRAAWIAEINTRTPLIAEDLIDGAVDVSWFHKIYDELGPERWEALYKAAVYSSGGGGHNRAKLFADAMLSRISKEEICSRITKKRHQDSVRALGLLPLPKKGNIETEILERYQLLQEFRRTSRKFGSQRQTSEKLAVRIAMENLARTAGYPDPARLQWAMEANEVADLVDGPVVCAVGGIELALSINYLGEPDLTITRDGKTLKSVPSKLRKDPGVNELRDRRTAIKRQASRMRFTLEHAMCRGDSFDKDELRSLLEHPVLSPMISQLIFIGEKSEGYLIKGGDQLEIPGGKSAPVSGIGTYRIAHPYDLLRTDRWHDWQRECFQRERIQPFKQVFRELYVLTPQEKKQVDHSSRYAGHQVNPRQALALFGQRGWVIRPEVGIQRTFHTEKISAHVGTDGGVLTPQEVEGITIDRVLFSRRGEWNPLELTDVPPMVFSETMRDIDLVVSVAHMGGVDPEASASTIEMRTLLLQETCSMLGIGNVRLKGSHALVDGELGNYSVHMGSAVVHRQPGGSICIVPIHQQHRGRLFLPFVDDDPRTAEVISKVLLLAKDTEIKDPTILEQILN